jgi:hypothetical protein
MKIREHHVLKFLGELVHSRRLSRIDVEKCDSSIAPEPLGTACPHF